MWMRIKASRHTKYHDRLSNTSADTNNSQNAYGNQNNYGNQNQYSRQAGGNESEIPGNRGRKYCDCSHSFDCNMRTLWNLLDDL